MAGSRAVGLFRRGRNAIANIKFVAKEHSSDIISTIAAILTPRVENWLCLSSPMHSSGDLPVLSSSKPEESSLSSRSLYFSIDESNDTRTIKFVSRSLFCREGSK